MRDILTNQMWPVVILRVLVSLSRLVALKCRTVFWRFLEMN